MFYSKNKPVYDLDFDSTIVKFMVDTDNRLNLILKKIKKDKTISTKELSKICSVSQITIKRDFEKLKKQNVIKRIGNAKTGYWEIIKK